MWQPLDPDGSTVLTTGLFFHCMACGDAQPVVRERRHCLCGRTSARDVRGEVLIAGPGRVSRTGVLARDRDEAPVRRPRVWAVH